MSLKKNILRNNSNDLKLLVSKIKGVSMNYQNQRPIKNVNLLVTCVYEFDVTVVVDLRCQET